MLSPKMMQNLTRSITQSLKPMTTENKAQSTALQMLANGLAKEGGGSGGMNKAVKDMSGTLQKIAKMIEMQNNLLSEIKPEDLSSGDDEKGSEKARELEEAVKKVTDENKKQAAEVTKLLAEIDKAAREAEGDKDAGKKIKAATAALEKAVKLIDEQSKLLEEARKALA